MYRMRYTITSFKPDVVADEQALIRSLLGPWARPAAATVGGTIGIITEFVDEISVVRPTGHVQSWHIHACESCEELVPTDERGLCQDCALKLGEE